MPLTVRGNVLSTLTRLQLLVQDGTAAAPSIAFTNRPQSGLYRAGAGAVGIAVDGVEIVRISSAGLASTYFTGNGSQLTGIGNLSVSNVQITDSGFIPIDDTAVSNSGGYCLVNGTGFREPLGMLLGASIAPTNVTVVSQTQARVQTPAMPNGTYPLWVFTDTSSTIKNAALQVSPVPIWSTAATLANVTKYTAFTQSLVATEPLGSNIVYTLSNGSTLPANVTLTSNGVLSGNILTDPGNTTTYNFSIDATDTQFQNIPRVFGLTAFTLVIVATGGTITYSDVYTIHTFTTSGTFALTSNPGNRTFEVLVVAGGGGGGNTNPAIGYEAGGGGAGGLLYNTAYVMSTQSYSVTIGSGGGGSTNGGSTTLSTLTAIGGGSGASAGAAGGSGGSGGGGSHWGTAGGSGTSGQGYAGGTGAQSRGAGGGGAGQAGNTNGTGGNGLQISISGTPTYYAGGGGGSGGGVGGLGGGGSAGSFDQNGRNATGYGSGGGGAYSSASYAGGTGSPGIVIIRYRNVY